MKEFVEVQGQFYIRANASIADAGTRVLKYADTFAIFDRHGDIRPVGYENHGVFHEGTRYLSHWKLRLNGTSPLLLGSNVREENDFLAVDLTNPVLDRPPDRVIPSGALHVARTLFLWDGDFFERIELSNFALERVAFGLELDFGADYVDLFEVRGTSRTRRGELGAPAIDGNEVRLSYHGLDGLLRQTRIHFSDTPRELSGERAVFAVELAPQEKSTIECQIRCVTGQRTIPVENFAHAFAKVHHTYEQYRKRLTTIETSNSQFNDWIRQSRADLHMLVTPTPDGPYPYAGIPWFSCIFGRDGIITALETLWVVPEIARAVLSHLAARQATELNAAQDAEPGKILHEARKGEMAALGEVPFGNYYGSIDSTPLWLMLAGAYYERTGDQALIERLWPNIERALAWIDLFGDCDGDGFVEYRQKSPDGLNNQGWKDSNDSVFHADGLLAAAPIALCEVQGYVFEAKTQVARLAELLGHQDIARKCREAAELLKRRFHEAFWCDNLGSYAIALDGAKRPCRIRSSNAGHCLTTGIAEESAAESIKDGLLGNAFFSGWGIRTIASSEPQYNPMSYHNGSIWPHDNALIAGGFARYGFKQATVRVLDALFEASQFMESRRLPELYCGFTRREGEGPVLYPVACNPQAWSSASLFYLIQSSLGLRIDATTQRLYFENPRLPSYLQQLEIFDLRVGLSTVDLAFVRYGDDVAANIVRRDGKLDVIVTH